MKLINNRWYDENNNSWNADIETEESSLKKSKSLIYCSDCSDCSYCSDCRGCSDCSYCRGCSGIKSNPQRYVTPKIGSRNSQTSIYWTTKDDAQIICGCWRGNIADFKKRVKEVHAKTEHLNPYLKQIKIFKMLVKQ
jgi:hypothetical protein